MAIPNNCGVKDNKVSVGNLTSDPQTLMRYEHFCQIRPLCVTSESDDHAPMQLPLTVPANTDLVKIDPGELLVPAIVSEFKESINDFSDVFEHVREGYNGVAGDL